MPAKRVLGGKRSAKVPKLARGTAYPPSPNSNVLSQAGFEELDEETLLSLSMDAPVRLTPPPGNNSRSSESSPTPLSKTRVSKAVMEATLEQLGFGPPNDLSNLHISPSPTPANSENSTAGTSHEEKVPTVKAPVSTAEERLPTVEASGTDDSDAYGQITELFQQIAQKTGHSVHSIILEWALLHAQTDLVKGRVAHGHLVSNAMTVRQQAFEDEANNVIKLGARLADLGFDLMFVMVGQNTAEDISLGKLWSTPRLQGMFEELSLSDNEILAAARLHSYSSMWSQFCRKYKQGQAEPPVGGDDETAAGGATADIRDMTSYIEKQSAAAASAYLSAPHKNKDGIKKPTKGSPLPAFSGGSPSSTSSDSVPYHVPKPVRNERSALSVLQDMLLGHN